LYQRDPATRIVDDIADALFRLLNAISHQLKNG